MPEVMLGAVLLSFVVTVLSLFLLRRVAPSWGLLDHPSERKLHQDTIPLIGGISVGLGVFVSLFWSLSMTPMLSSFFVGCGMVVFVGILDDIYDVSIRIRLIGQGLAACVIIISGETALLTLGNLLGFGTIYLGEWSLPFTVFAMVGIMNAFNMIDGIDGFLGAGSIVAASSVAVLSLVSGNSTVTLISLVFVAALLPYLCLNLLPAGHRYKVFMGDAGSLLMGFSLCWLFIVASQPHLSTRPVMEPVTALFLVAIPLMDIFTVMARRIKQKRSPYQADRQHIHHLLGKAGLTDKQSLVYLSLMMLLSSSLGVVMQLLEMPEWQRFLGFLGLIPLYILVTKLLKRQMTKRLNQIG